MELTSYEEKALDGEYGEAVRLAMRAVVKVGEALGAERLVPVTWAHVSGISYKNIGDAGLEFLEELAAKGARVSVRTTVNPAGMDMEHWREMGVDEGFAEKQARVVKALISMGVEAALTCTPYLYGKVGLGEHLAWAESNAVLYANSILGARTNREGGPLALFEAIVGRAPYVGLHTDEGRRASLVVDFEDVRDLVAQGYHQAAGYLLGRIAGKRVAVAKGLPPMGSWEAKLFLAAVGASGGTGLVYIPGVSPEEPRIVEGAEEVPVDKRDMEEVLEYFNGKPEAAALGCPHLSSRELEDIVSYIERRGGARRPLVLFTARALKGRLGDLEKRAEKAGARIFYDTCMVVSPLRSFLGSGVAVDSAKAAYYLSAQGYAVKLMSRRELLDYVTGGGGED